MNAQSVCSPNNESCCFQWHRCCVEATIYMPAKCSPKRQSCSTIYLREVVRSQLVDDVINQGVRSHRVRPTHNLEWSFSKQKVDLKWLVRPTELPTVCVVVIPPEGNTSLRLQGSHFNAIQRTTHRGFITVGNGTATREQIVFWLAALTTCCSDGLCCALDGCVLQCCKEPSYIGPRSPL
ncbi:uncharacterized protein LOC100831284 isoform X2 [Brachypodium distachyon]|uniref:uncharacterized protein LOC100831284 isoform X2 n=1 Tax=Brachypodium distachyon TaxID=15368 RepID=UPI000D0DDCEF|nr:uncharacterized protein LOC100831284 isoform X2 [Brachypodium distachyon]|eukprot:XP_024311037.1 uncharacterized protein LOC100831284 isoform X2 [Brachypodium distachyon]